MNMLFMLQAYIVQFVSILTQLLIFAIFARVVLSWLRVPARGFLFSAIFETTEPILSVFRKAIPPLGGVLDLSPLFAFLALDLIKSLIIRLFS